MITHMIVAECMSRGNDVMTQNLALNAIKRQRGTLISIGCGLQIRTRPSVDCAIERLLFVIGQFIVRRVALIGLFV